MPSEIEARVPPTSLEAERALLGSALISPDACLDMLERIEVRYFYSSAHREIFNSIVRLFEADHPVDLVALATDLHAHGKLVGVGGQGYLVQVMDEVPSPGRVAYYAGVVREKHLRRQLIAGGQKIIEGGFNEAVDIDALLDDAEGHIFRVAEGREATEASTIRELVHEQFDKLSELSQRRISMTGLPTGLSRMDTMLSGLQEADLVVLAARPSVGKTALACGVARHLTVEEKVPVAFFSLEMTRAQLTRRLLCLQGQLCLQHTAGGRLSPEDWAKLTMSAGKLSEAPLFIDDTPGISPLEIRAKARRLVARHGVKAIFVDYLQLIRMNTRHSSRQQEVSEISMSLKNLAKEVNCPVVALSQLSRDSVKAGRKPNLSDLRESGAIEQDADVVILLYRRDEKNRGVVTADVAKQRNGPTGHFDLAFVEHCARFGDLETRRAGGGA